MDPTVNELMRCDIVIATWNAVAMTQAALASIRSEANFPYRLILVDNSDEEDARAYFRDIAASKEFGDTLLVQNEANIGWLKATNIGLAHANAEYVCLLNNDVLCGTDWLNRCVDLMRREPSIAIVNPRGNERSENRRVADVNAYAGKLAREQDRRFTELDHCSGFCMVVRGSLFREIGLLDPIFDGGYFEDNDFSHRAQAAGYRCAQCDDSFVLHLVSQSFKKMPAEQKRQMIARNEEICRQRWGARRRQLLLVRKSEVNADDLIALIRQHQVYLVDNSHIPETVRVFRHQNLRLLRPGPLGDMVCFLWRSFYLYRKQRIDEARILYA
jgi:GT2 family glycosyltransferase